MTALTTPASALADRADRATPGGLTRWLQHTRALIGRNLIHVRREPMQLSDATIQPVLFTLLFVYVFGGAIAVGGSGSYKQFAIGGLLAMNLTTGAMGTAVGICTDLTTGVVDRFRTLPTARSSLLVGRAVADLVSATLAASIVLITGLCIGWRPGNGAASVLGAAAIALVWAFAMSWFTMCIGLLSDSAESAQGLGFIILLPASFVSNAFVPTTGMPAWLRAVANWNPVSAIASALRTVLGNPNPSASIDSWPMQHPLLATLAWSALIVGVCCPLAVALFRRRTVD